MVHCFTLRLSGKPKAFKMLEMVQRAKIFTPVLPGKPKVLKMAVMVKL